jgi:RNA polymerase sigma-70 factor (ECF subfamily)
LEGTEMTIERDEAAVRAVRRGEKEAFAVLVNRHKESVYGMLMRLTCNRQAAEELAHETFVRAFRRLSSFRGESRFSTWLIQIAINLARDYAREQGRNRVVSLDAMLEQDPDSPVLAEAYSRSDPLNEMEESELIEQFENALEELPQSYREVFVLRHLQNVSYEDIAEATGDSVGSLKVRAHRARKLLKERLFPETEYKPQT